MDLFTRCTRCETIFRVTTGDLQASGGQVRCGRCQAVFDAFASLTAKPPSYAQGDTSENTQSSEHGDDTAADAGVPAAQDSAEPATLPEQAPKPDATTDTETPAAGVTPATLAAPPVATDRPESDLATNLFEWEFKATPKPARTRLWLSLSILLALTAIGQAAYAFRTPLMVNYPQVRPLYEQACVWLSCQIGLPRLADQLDIDSSDLQLIDPRKRNQVELTALVRNRARVAVEYPAFELTLTNAKEQVVARRVFLPDEYLADGTSTEEGLAGRAELTVRLFLDIGPLGAAGYRIYLFYPP